MIVQKVHYPIAIARHLNHKCIGVLENFGATLQHGQFTALNINFKELGPDVMRRGICIKCHRVYRSGPHVQNSPLRGCNIAGLGETGVE